MSRGRAIFEAIFEATSHFFRRVFHFRSTDLIILILRRLSKTLPRRFLIKVFFAEIKYGVHRSNGNICVRVVFVFFGGNLDLRKCKFLT
jgi:hypothetical protein